MRPNRGLLATVLIALLVVIAGCEGDKETGSPPDGAGADVNAPDGLGFPADFTFGAASSAHQIEGGNTNNNWYQFETLAQYEGQTAEPSGQAANSYVLWQTDNQLVEDTHLDAYRFSIEWSRIVPERGVFDTEAIAHYRALIEDLAERGIRPFVTLHHFTDPIWLNDLSDPDCANGPSDANLCGWPNPDAVTSFVEYAERMASEYGDLVDQWATFNEPNTVTAIGYLLGVHAPGNPGGQPVLPDDARWQNQAATVARAFTEAHVRAYDRIHEVDTVDADGDGQAARVGWTMAAQYAESADPDNPVLGGLVERYTRFLNFLYPDAVSTGVWDPDIDGEADENHPEWIGKQDFIGVQYYARVFVVQSPFQGEILDFAPCIDLLATILPACPTIDPLNRSAFNEVYPEGLYEVVRSFAARYPGVPLPITENGAAADSGERKAQILVRHLQRLHRLLEEGYPVDAYYAWSLTDNFEWAEGFDARFGIYHVDYNTFERTPTRAQEVLAEVAATGVLSAALVEQYGAGPLLPDE